MRPTPIFATELSAPEATARLVAYAKDWRESKIPPSAAKHHVAGLSYVQATNQSVDVLLEGDRNRRGRCTVRLTAAPPSSPNGVTYIEMSAPLRENLLTPSEMLYLSISMLTLSVVLWMMTGSADSWYFDSFLLAAKIGSFVLLVNNAGRVVDALFASTRYREGIVVILQQVLGPEARDPLQGPMPAPAEQPRWSRFTQGS